MRSVRIGAGQGFYGDSLLPVLDVAKYGNVKYIAFDTLAELTMAILEKGRQRDPGSGFTRDLIPMMRNLLPVCHEAGIRLVTNAGGTNPARAAAAMAQLARELGLPLRIAYTTGDHILDGLDWYADHGADFVDPDSGRRLADVRDKVFFANVYLGAGTVKAALDTGADLVITGRTTDTAQFLGPILHEFQWPADDWSRLAQGIIMGHLLECSGQVVGGNFAAGWQDVPELWRIGYPIAEVFEDGRFIVTKAPGTGGVVTEGTVKEQLLYEIHDPTAYVVPDAVCDLTTIQIRQIGPDMVEVTGTTGRPKPSTLKALVGYHAGWAGENRIGFSWPNALDKARLAERIVRERLAMHGMDPDLDIHTEYIGVNSLWGALAPEPAAEPNEVYLRMAIRSDRREDCEVLAREFAPLLLSGPPTAAAVHGTPPPRSLIGLMAGLVPRDQVEPFVQVHVVEVQEADLAGAAHALSVPAAPAATHAAPVPPAAPAATRSEVRGWTRLIELAHGRSGDKGNISDISLFAWDEAAYEILRQYVTAEKVMAYFAPIAAGPVQRYEVPNLMALKFVIRGALGGGAPRSLRSDNLGKTLAAALLHMEIEVI